MWVYPACNVSCLCVHVCPLACATVSQRALSHGRGGQLCLPTQAQSSITHNFLCFGTSPSPGVLTDTHTYTHPHTQTHSTVLDTYLTASNSLQSLLREDKVRWLCLEGLLPLS